MMPRRPVIQDAFEQDLLGLLLTYQIGKRLQARTAARCLLKLAARLLKAEEALLPISGIDWKQ